MVLQIVGFVLALWDLLSLGKLFQVPVGPEAIRNYLAGFKLRGAVIDFEPATIEMRMGDVRVQIGRNPNATMEARMARAENQIDALDDRMENLAREQKEDANHIRHALKEQAVALRSELAGLSNKVRVAAIGGLKLQIVGVFYFLFGVFMTSASQEIAGWLG